MGSLRVKKVSDHEDCRIRVGAVAVRVRMVNQGILSHCKGISLRTSQTAYITGAWSLEVGAQQT